MNRDFLLGSILDNSTKQLMPLTLDTSRKWKSILGYSTCLLLLIVLFASGISNLFPAMGIFATLVVPSVLYILWGFNSNSKDNMKMVIGTGIIPVLAMMSGFFIMGFNHSFGFMVLCLSAFVFVGWFTLYQIYRFNLSKSYIEILGKKFIVSNFNFRNDIDKILSQEERDKIVDEAYELHLNEKYDFSYHNPEYVISTKYSGVVFEFNKTETYNDTFFVDEQSGRYYHTPFGDIVHDLIPVRYINFQIALYSDENYYDEVLVPKWCEDNDIQLGVTNGFDFDQLLEMAETDGDFY